MSWMMLKLRCERSLGVGVPRAFPFNVDHTGNADGRMMVINAELRPGGVFAVTAPLIGNNRYNHDLGISVSTPITEIIAAPPQAAHIFCRMSRFRF
jgi:hypothetical protein